MTHDPQHTQTNQQQAFAPPLAAPTVAPIQPLAGPTGQGVSKLGAALRAAPAGLKMVYGGAVAMVIASRLPLATVGYDGESSPVPFSSAGSVILLTAAGILVWLGAPALSGGLPRRRVVGMTIVTAVMALITVLLFVALPEVAKQSDPLSGLSDVLDLPHPTASAGLGLVVLTVSVIVVAVGTVRLSRWTKSRPGTN